MFKELVPPSAIVVDGPYRVTTPAQFGDEALDGGS